MPAGSVWDRATRTAGSRGSTVKLTENALLADLTCQAPPVVVAHSYIGLIPSSGSSSDIGPYNSAITRAVPPASSLYQTQDAINSGGPGVPSITSVRITSCRFFDSHPLFRLAANIVRNFESVKNCPAAWVPKP
jgi:hypothetical protein